MRNLQYFNPDPNIPDADLLGYGDLIYDDGSTEYLPGDPEMSSSLPGLPPGMSPQSSQFGPPAPQSQMGPPPPPVPIPGPNGQQLQLDMTGNLSPISDPMSGQVMPQQDAAGATDLGDMARGAAGGIGQALEIQPLTDYANGVGGDDQGGGGLQAPQPVTFTADNGQPYTLDATGNIKQGGGGMPMEQLQQQASGPGGMVPAQREGALPPEMAQRQLAELGGAQQDTIDATGEAQRQQYQLYNEMTLKQMAANEAERVKREQDIADQQAKVERWQGEQQQLLSGGIENDLISARGPVGGVFAAIGATLLGAAGNDTGFRMIERQIDQHVRNQVSVRDTKLGILAQQIGSSQQAIAMGKAALYKVAADKTELLAQKTKNDVFEAQSPAIIAQLRQKSVEELQKAEQQSIGKTLEKVPLPPKPPTPQMMQKYGELRRDRAGNDTMLQRMEQQTGLVWSPGQDGQPGHYSNAPEVIKNGIQGVGAIEQWLPDFVYSTAGKAAEQGYQVRGAKQAIAFAVVRSMQPTGPISDVDRKVGEMSATLDTEDGLVNALTRLRTSEEQQKAMDIQQFGPNVVNEFDRRGGGSQAPAQPTPSRPATVEEMRGSAQQLRQQKPTAAAPAASATIPTEPAQRMAQVREDVAALASDLPPEGQAILVAQAAHESGEGDSQGAANGNMFGHKQTGGRAGFEANTTEGEGAGARRVKQSFAAYPTITAATADHLSLIKRKYPRAWEALELGDSDAYVGALKDGGYFTGNESAYLKAIQRRL